MFDTVSRPPAARPLLEVSNLSVGLDVRGETVLATQDVTFALRRGEILGIVGESGAGKSLTGSAIIGLLDPPLRKVAGEIRLDGERIDMLSGQAMRRVRGRRIGTIFQDPLTSLDPLFTVGQQLSETMRAHLDVDAKTARRLGVELLAKVGIASPEERIEFYPHEFSGGMRQRVVIALALCANPQLIIADEPTTALDVSVQAQIMTLLRRLCRERATAMILVTHDMGVIAQTADRVCVMYAGRLVEIGPVKEVIRKPKHPYTAGLMASIPKLGPSKAPLAQIKGAMPRPGALPRGCSFHPRCPLAFARCALERPALFPTGPSEAACWLHEPGLGKQLS